MEWRVTSVGLDPRTWQKVVGPRVDIVEQKDIFANCVNGRSIGRMFECYWNDLVDDPRETVRVIDVRPA